MHMKKLTAIILFCIACRTESPAQEKIYSLRDCMQYALEHSADMEISRADIDDDRIARRDAILKTFTPSVSANAHVYSNFGRAIDPETNTYVSTTSFNNAYSVSAGIDLFNGFEAVNNIKIARTSQSMGLDEKQRKENEICLATMEAYCNVLYYKELSGILESQVNTAKESLELAKRQEELGQKSYADVVQMEADLADRKYQEITAQNSLKDAYITLKDIMFWPADEKLDIDMSLVSEDSPALWSDSASDVDDILGNAKAFLPDIAIAKGRLDNAKLELRTARWKIAPSLSLYGGWSTSYYTYPGQEGYIATPFWTQFTNNGGEYLQLTLSIPVFNRLSRHSDIARKRNEYKRSEAEYDKTMRNVESEVRRAVQDRDGAQAAYIQAERMAAVQEEAYHLNRKKFDQGLISSIEYKSASEDFLKSRAERLNSLLKYYIKKSVVSYYNGISYIDQQL